MEKFPMTAEGHAMLENELMHRRQHGSFSRSLTLALMTVTLRKTPNITRHRNYRKQTRAALQNLKTSWRAPKSSTLLSYPGTPSNLVPRLP